MPSPAVVRHFDGAAAGYGTFRNSWPLSLIRSQERAALTDLMRVQAGELVLDAGCGDGELLAWLEASRARLIGIDIARAMARQCRRRGYRVAVQDLERPALRAVFDWVVCFGSLEFTGEPGRALASLAGLLRPGGRFVLLFPRQSALGWLYAAYHRIAHGVRIHLFQRRQITDWMRDAHLDETVAWRDLSLSTICVAQSLPPTRLEAGRIETPRFSEEQ